MSLPTSPVGAATPDPKPTAMPTPDRLATPEMPESPTQIDIGRELYYYHCMPCHGDRGQGLTDEWRQVWGHDHQNCWGHGCHTGRAGEEGFFIPRYVPPVISSEQALGHFQTAEDLFTYIRATQPPQTPGTLSDTQYWSLTAFLLDENDRATLPNIGSPEQYSITTVAGMLLLLMTLYICIWAAKRRKRDSA